MSEFWLGVIAVFVFAGAAIIYSYWEECKLCYKKMIATAINDAKSEHNLWNKFRQEK